MHVACRTGSETAGLTADGIVGTPDGGVLFAQAASPAPLTLPSHSSILTGLYPTYHGVRLNGTAALGQNQTTLAEVFADRGYQTGAFVGGFPVDSRFGLAQGFDTYDDSLGRSRSRVSFSERPARGLWRSPARGR